MHSFAGITVFVNSKLKVGSRRRNYNFCNLGHVMSDSPSKKPISSTYTKFITQIGGVNLDSLGEKGVGACSRI
jgi:hypothetical protein